MPTPRARQVSLEATADYHCISRCVRRAFLCGTDRLTGKSFDHRRRWIADRLLELSTIFAIDVCAYGLMSSHFHVVLHVDRPRALAWNDDDVVARYGSLFPQAVRQAQGFLGAGDFTMPLLKTCSRGRTADADAPLTPFLRPVYRGNPCGLSRRGGQRVRNVRK